jgi:hypothetical protein
MQTMTVRPTDTERSDDDRPQPFRVTARVLSIFATVGRFGVLTSEQIACLDGGSRQKVTRILQHAVEHELLKRPGAREDRALTSFFDTRPRPYALTAKGFRALADAGVIINAKPNKSEVLLQHAIETAHAMFSVDAAVAAHGALRLIDHHDLLPLMSPATRSLRKSFCLHTTVRPTEFPHLRRLLKEPTDIGVEPDRLFCLVQADNTGWSFALELDRGTEDITTRRIKGKATYFRKLLGYYNCWRTCAHISQWGEFCKSFRVLSVTTSDVRIQNMIAAQEEITRGAASGLFLYSTPQRVAEHGALGPVWTNSKRSGISLLDRE